MTKKQLEESHDHQYIENPAMHKVIMKLQGRKKAWIDLSEDLVSVADRMKKMN
jgi:hypothetical protein